MTFPDLKEFLADHPHIAYATPPDPDYASLRESFVTEKSLNPQVIIRPQSASDIASLLPVLAKTNIPFAIRTGGHDIFNRSQAHDGVTIDMRDIADIHVSEDTTSAKIGGGVISQTLTEHLETFGLTTPCPVTGTVGYVGWATHGGYGPLSTLYGLGVDQILAAKVATASGEIIDADDELLVGIRGAGGAFGVIVELTIKVYPYHDFLGGVIQFPSPSVSDTIQSITKSLFLLGKETPLPENLGIFQGVMNGESPVFSMLFLWTSITPEDVDLGESWLQKILALAPNPIHTVGKTTLSKQLALALTPPTVYGTLETASIRSISPAMIDIITRAANMMPAGAPVMLALHQLKGRYTQADSRSVFGARLPHYVVEIICITPDMTMEDAVRLWGKNVLDDFQSDGSGDVLRGTYLNLTSPEKVDLDAIYGDDGLAVIRRLKSQYDPANLFCNALVRL